MTLEVDIGRTPLDSKTGFEINAVKGCILTQLTSIIVSDKSILEDTLYDSVIQVI